MVRAVRCSLGRDVLAAAAARQPAMGDGCAHGSWLYPRRGTARRPRGASCIMAARRESLPKEPRDHFASTRRASPSLFVAEGALAKRSAVPMGFDLAALTDL